jgi:hypothetical protein
MAKKSILGIAQDQMVVAARAGMRAVADSAADALSKSGAAAVDAVSRTTKKVANIKLRSKKPAKANKKSRTKKKVKKKPIRRSAKKRL